MAGPLTPAKMGTRCLHLRRTQPTRLSHHRLSSTTTPPSALQSRLHAELTARKLPLLYDTPSSTPTHLLTTTLSTFLPLHPSRLRPGPPQQFQPIPPAHHLVYFNPPTLMSDLLPDGTDPDQSPGEPWVRRMWAGGKMEFRPWGSSTREGGEGVRWVTGGEGVVCREAIKDVQVKGKEGEEKIFVSIERRVGGLRQRKSVVSGLGGEEVRGLMEGQENVGVVERRDLVFLRERDGPGVKADAAKGKGGDRVVKASGKADFEHRMTPNAALLFRFSALTFNAHRIHLDREYCREVEGHRNLLFHGPLSCVCMLELLGRQLLDRGLEKSLGGQEVSREQIVGFEYRNLAPLYADEEMRICGREKGKGEWELWIEGRDGGLAVRGTARTMTRDEWSERKARMQGDTGTEDQQALRTLAAS